MATRTHNLPDGTPSLLIETDIPDWSDLSAEHYFSNLTRYLRNITLSLSRPRLSDLISVDKDVGLVWLISIPVAYFVVVAIILTVLLLCFWYVDTSGGVSPALSEASVSTATASSLKEENHGRSIKHDTMVVNEMLNSPYHSSVRSYLINAEFQDILRISDGSKGSTRSLGVLTEKDLQLPYKYSASAVSSEVTPTGRKQSMNIHECPSQLVGVSDGKFDSRTFTRVKSSFRTAVRSEVDLKTAKGSGSSRSISSFSTDSLEEKVSADSLGASMEFHKNVRATGGDIGPGELYGGPGFVQDSADRGFVQDSADRGFVQDLSDQGFLKDNHVKGKAESKMDRKFIFLNHIFTQNHMRNTDAHLKASYEAALKADRMKFYGNSTNLCSSSFFPSIHFPGYELSQYPRHKITPCHHAYTLNQENSDEFSETNQEYSVKNMGTNCQKMHFGSYITTHGNVKEVKENHVKGRLFTTDSSINESQISSVIYTGDDTRSSNDRQRNNHQHDISLASLVLSDEPRLIYSSDNYKDDFQAPDDVAAPDFDISNVSQIVLTSQEDFDNSQDSFGSGGVRPNEEGSFCSADNSLPSSIARFHASNIGQWPSPCAGYSLPSQSYFESSQNDCLCQDCPCKQSSRSSLFVNFGSCSDSTTAESQPALSQDNSFPPLSQDGTDCDPGSGKLEQGLVKLSKRPSPLSSFVNNIRQRYSLEDNCLKSKREVSDEEEALLLSPMLQKELGPKFNKQPSLDSKRRKVSVEERLQEYGFLKCKGKKYVINPSPGKYETGSGYYNLVFANNEDSGTPKYHQDQTNKQSAASRFIFPANGSMGDRSLTGGSEGILPFSQHPEEFANDYQFSPFMEDSFFNFSLSRFNQKDEFAVRATCFSLGQESTVDFERDASAVRAPCSDMGQERTSVFEAHCGDDSNFSDIDFTPEDSGNNQIAIEIPQSAPFSCPDRFQVVSNIVRKQNDSLAVSEKKLHKAQLLLGEFDYSGSKEAQSSGWWGIQTGLFEQTEATKYENTRNDTREKSQYICGNNKKGAHVNKQNDIYGNSLNNTCGKNQTGTYEHTQNGTYEHNHNSIYGTNQNFMQVVTQRYKKDQIDYYENDGSGKHGQLQNGKHETGHQNAVNKMERTKKSSSADFRDTRCIWEERATREGSCASLKSSVGKASMETEHKLQRQQTSRALLSLEKGTSRLSEMQQDPENGFSELYEIQLDQDTGFSGRCEKQLDQDTGFSGGGEKQQDREHSFTVAVDKLQPSESGLHNRSRPYRATEGNFEALRDMRSVRV